MSDKTVLQKQRKIFKIRWLISVFFKDVFIAYFVLNLWFPFFRKHLSLFIRKMNLLQMYCKLMHNKVLGQVKVTILPLGAFYKVVVRLHCRILPACKTSCLCPECCLMPNDLRVWSWYFTFYMLAFGMTLFFLGLHLVLLINFLLSYFCFFWETCRWAL